MRLPKSSAAMAAAMSVVLAAGAQVANAADSVLRFATINAEQTAAYKDVLEPFARKVAVDSGDRIEVALKPLGGYGKPADLFAMVERGEIEIAATVQGYSPGRFPQSSVMELPLMYETAISGTQAMWKLYQEGMLDRDYASVKVLGLHVLPPYGIFSAAMPIETLRDLRGMRVRTPSPTVAMALARLGMVPVAMPVNKIGNGLDAGTVDAITYGWESLTTTGGTGDKQLVDQVKILVDAKFAAPALMVVMNKATWEAMPADMRAVIERHAADLTLGNARLRDEFEQATRDRLRVDPQYTYLALTPQIRTEMEAAIQPAVNHWKAAMARQGVDGERLYARARELARPFHTASR
jgi:TRAP-type C4-dicarboxylate transport system substrate-binding protein